MSNVTLTYHFPSAAAAAAFAASVVGLLLHEQAAAIPATDVKGTSPGKSADKQATKDKPAATPPSASPAPAASATPAAESKPPASSKPAETKPVKYEDSGIGERIQKMVQKDRPGAVALLAKYGVKKGSELTPDQFDAIKADLDAALAPAAEATEADLS